MTQKGEEKKVSEKEKKEKKLTKKEKEKEDVSEKEKKLTKKEKEILVEKIKEKYIKEKFYCVAERKKDVEVSEITTVNIDRNPYMIVAKCKLCGKSISKFVSRCEFIK